jgi:hypothetical protein
MDVNEAKRRKCVDIDERKNYFKSMLWYNIRVALLEKHLSLSDVIHGPFKMMPPELLHTSGSGLIMYMFESLCHQLGGGNDRHFINQEHILYLTSSLGKVNGTIQEDQCKTGSLMEQSVSHLNKKGIYSG